MTPFPKNNENKMPRLSMGIKGIGSFLPFFLKAINKMPIIEPNMADENKDCITSL
jgi:hypothetical protein